MSDNEAGNEFTEIGDFEWQNVARKIFYECLTSSPWSSFVSSFSSAPSATDRVSVATLIDYIRDNVSLSCREGNNASSEKILNRNEKLLNELRKSIEQMSSNGLVNYALFKKASRRWLAETKRRQIQDGNNNLRKDDSSGDHPLSSSRSDDEKRHSTDSIDDTHFDFFAPCSKQTPSKFDTADFVKLENVSSYSPGSETTSGCERMSSEEAGGATESAEETDSGITVGGMFSETSDLRTRIRRFEEENALLHEDLLTAEELAASLQKQMQHLRLTLEETKAKCRQLEKKNDDHEELLHEAEQKERDYRWAIQKLEKEKNSLTKQVEDLEAEKQQIASLTLNLERCKKEKYECMRQIALCKRELEDRQNDCDELREQLVQLSEANAISQESYEKNIQRVRQKLRELKEERSAFHAPDFVESLSDGFRQSTSSTCGYSCPESSLSCNESRIHDSLYDELKASGFLGTNESRVRELEEELSSYEEEIRQAIHQMNNIVRELLKKRSNELRPYVDFDNSDENTSEMSLFLRTLSKLSNMVKEIVGSKAKVKDASCQLSLDTRPMDESLSSLFHIQSFQHISRSTSEKLNSEKREERNVFFGGNFVTSDEVFSLNSRLLGEYVEKVESHDPAEAPASEIQERYLIEPIVQELDRIIKSTNEKSTEPLPSTSPRLPKHRCIYTSVENSTFDSTGWNSPGDRFGSTYILGGGEGSREERMRTEEEKDNESMKLEKKERDRGQGESIAGGDCPKGCLESEPESKNDCPANETRIIDYRGSNRDDGREDSRADSRKQVTGISATETLETPTRRLPKRKISVFHRSFDIDSLSEETGAISERSRYRLRERASSLVTGNREDSLEDGFDPESMKMSSNTRKFLLSYRERSEENDDDGEPGSDDNPSPGRSTDDSAAPSLAENYSTRSIILTPARLNLTSASVKQTDISDRLERSDVSERSIEPLPAGVTFRKDIFSRENLDFSDFSLIEGTSENSPQDHHPLFARLDQDESYVDQDASSKRDEQEAGGDSGANENSKSRIPVAAAGVAGPAGRMIERRRKKHQAAMSEGVTVRKNHQEAKKKGEEDTEERASVSVTLAMSSGEDSSDSECDPMAIRSDIDSYRRNALANETRSVTPTLLNFVDGALLSTSTPANLNNNNEYLSNNNLKKLDEIANSQAKSPTSDRREKGRTIRRSLSESGCASWECCECHSTKSPLSSQENPKKEEPRVFPSLTDARLQEAGLAKLSSNNDEITRGSLSEAELERKYMALSIGLVTDRVTLPRRVALSIRQRDQSEKNLASEVQKMHQDIQDLAPLCIDRESVERVERVKHQLEMINKCAHRISCTAETLGAVHQESRVSRAILLADRYVLLLRSRCDKLALDLSETKRILSENNIVIEEHNGELGSDDMPRTRYRAVPITNRTMMARRRASIATIFRPLGNFQEVTKEGLRQRNSVSGRVTLRRPSLTAESQKWEVEKLDRTDSSSSIGELREIFEQAESRRNSREENNNSILRLHSSNLSLRDSEAMNEADFWNTAREDPTINSTQLTPIPSSPIDDITCDHQSGIATTTASFRGRRALTDWITNNRTPWKSMLWCIIISFFFGFYANQAVSSTSECTGRNWRWWSVEEIRDRFYNVQEDNLPRPI